MTEKRQKKRNFTEAEVEVILTQVHANKKILFSSVSSGVTAPEKAKTWKQIRDEVNSVPSVERSITEVKRKWFDMKTESKKRTAANRQSLSATGGGQIMTKLLKVDERVGAILGETSISGIPGVVGDSDVPQEAPIESLQNVKKRK